MDEKTEELRDIFLDVADDPSVTTSQAPSRGSLDDDGVDGERLRGVIERMRGEYAFDTDLDVATYAAVVRLFYEGHDDEAIAAELDLERETVFAARADLHLLRESDAGPVDPGALDEQLGTAPSADAIRECAGALDVEVAAVRRALRVREARRAARQASHRWAGAFADCLPEADLAETLTAETRADGLDEATADAEVDVDL